MPNQFDELIPNAKVARRLGVTVRTMFRWTAQPELCFPKPCIINSRRYFSAAEIDAWQASRKPGAVAQAAPEAPALVAPMTRPKPSPIDRARTSEVVEV
jgi:predicted DNA-binding transcriptional regulator AlpA